MKKTIIFFLFVLVLVGCSKDNNPVSDLLGQLIFNFTNGYNQGQGYVILYNADGSSVIELRSFSNDAVVDFGELEDERVTITIVYSRLYSGVTYHYIVSYISAPKGEWTFNGRNPSNKGSFTVNVSFPSGEYDYCFLGTNDYYSRRNIYSGQSSFSFHNDYIYYLNTAGNFDIYGSVYNESIGNGYAGWLLNQPYSSIVDNVFDLALNTPIGGTTILANRNFDQIRIDALITASLDRIPLFYQYYNNVNSAVVYVPLTFPASKYRITASIYESQYDYYFSKISNQMTTNLTIPSGTISATFNPDQYSFQNISTVGDYDELNAWWYYYDFENNLRYSWDVFAPKGTSSFQRPALPQSVLLGISNLDISNLEYEGISIFDYDAASSMDDIIEMFYKSDTNPYETYTTFYRYTQR